MQGYAHLKKESMKLYFETEDSEFAYQIEHFDEVMERPFELFEAVPCKVEGFFFCKAVNGCAEEGECGRLCDDYDPCNGKSGMCRHKGRLYEKGGIISFN